MHSESAEIFRSKVQAHLAVLDQELVVVLRALIEHRYPPEVFAISFEVFSDSFTSQFPARAFFVDRGTGVRSSIVAPLNPLGRSFFATCDWVGEMHVLFAAFRLLGDRTIGTLEAMWQNNL